MNALLSFFAGSASVLQQQCISWFQQEQKGYGRGDALLYLILRSGCFGSSGPQTDAFILTYNDRKRAQRKVAYSLRKMIAEAVPRDLFAALHDDPFARASEWLEQALQIYNRSDWQTLATRLTSLQATQESFRLVSSDLLQPLIEKYSLSASGLNNFLECRRRFYFENLLRIPQQKLPSMQFGSAVHYSLEKLFAEMKQNNGRFDKEEKLVQWFEEYLQGNGLYTDDDFEERLEKGRLVLPLYYQRYIQEWSRVVVVEKLIRGVQFHDVPLLGFIDKLEFNGTDVTIVDYKTGSWEKALKRLEPPSAEQEMGGSYWRQAQFYKILVDHDNSNTWRAVSAYFDFIEPVNGTFQRKEIVFDKASTETITQLIKNVWSQIGQVSFEQPCSAPDCPYCQHNF